MKLAYPRIICSIYILVLTLLIPAHQAKAREITDMTGRRVTVPDSIKRIYAPSPYGSYILYAIAPEKLTGLMFPLKDEDKKFLHPYIHNLPVIGGLTGEGMTGNIEIIMKNRPDVLLMWASKTGPPNRNPEKILQKLNIPYAYATVDTMQDYAAAFNFIGKLLGKEKLANRQAAYCRKTLSDVDNTINKIPMHKRPKVYYAEGLDGLSTECDDSIHVQLLKLAGDTNVHRCHTSNHKGFEKISLEQVIMYAPDIIIVQEKVFFNKIRKDHAWQQVKAVRNGKVYLIPHTPFNWFDRPPSFMRFLGLKWLMNTIYPDQYRVDMIKETQKFYKLFLGTIITKTDSMKILNR